MSVATTYAVTDTDLLKSEAQANPDPESRRAGTAWIGARLAGAATVPAGFGAKGEVCETWLAMRRDFATRSRTRRLAFGSPATLAGAGGDESYVGSLPGRRDDARV